MAGAGGGRSQQQEQLKQRPEGQVRFSGRISGGFGAAGIRNDRRGSGWGGGQAPAWEGPECWAREHRLCQGGHGGGLKQEGGWVRY